MAELTDMEIDAARKRGQIARATEPRAVSVRYDKRRGRITVELTNGCVFAFPPRLIEGLQTASDATLAAVEILGAGFGLHWQDADIDVSIPGLMAGIFGTRAFMARQAGQVTTPRKAAAARQNGAKGGRPAKAAG